jgi:hypothetical protein
VERIAVIGYQTTEETGIATSRSMTEEIAATYRQMTGGTENR